jgi:hypothetical protein
VKKYDVQRDFFTRSLGLPTAAGLSRNPPERRQQHPHVVATVQYAQARRARRLGVCDRASADRRASRRQIMKRNVLLGDQIDILAETDMLESKHATDQHR